MQLIPPNDLLSPDLYETSDERIHDTAKHFHVIKEFRDAHPGMYQLAYKRNILEDVIGHMDRAKKWTHATIYKEALKYGTRTAFSGGNSSAYQAALRTKVIEDVCAHMPEPKNPRWTVERVYKCVSRYHSYAQFKNNTPAYRAADRMHLLKSISEIFGEDVSNLSELDTELEENMSKIGIKKPLSNIR